MSNLRERKKRRTREAIIEAAQELFAVRGFDAVTVDEIADVVAVSRRTIFRYFRTKEALAFPDVEARLARFRASLALRAPGDTPLRTVQRALLAIAAEYMSDREVVLAQQRIVDGSDRLVAAERAHDLEWESAIEGTLLERSTRPDREAWARTVAGAVFGVIRATLRAWFESGGESDLVELGAGALHILAEGLDENGRRGA